MPLIVRSLAGDNFDCKTEPSTGRREACCLEDAVLSRAPNWERMCIVSYFNSSWNDSPFELGR